MKNDGASPSSSLSIPSDTAPPSVEQTLVPEGVFAKQLAEALKLGPLTDEAKAEELLSGLGIEPKNGWITEYPVTPAVLGDIEKGISAASDQGKLALKKDQVLKLVDGVKAQLGFDVNPGLKAPARLTTKPGNMIIYSYTDSKGEIYYTDVYDSIPKQYRNHVRTISRSPPHEQTSSSADENATEAPGPQYMANPPPEYINDYYYDQGPPIVTYYSPPAPYYYLYSWVPYPFWSTGFYFPGFFVLNNFHRHVFFNRQPYFVRHHDRDFDHHNLSNVGTINQPFPDHLKPNNIVHSPWFASPNAQAGARAIVSLNQRHDHSFNRSSDSQMEDASRQPFSSAVNSRFLGEAPAVLHGREMMRHELFRSVPYSGGNRLSQPSPHQVMSEPIPRQFYSSPAIDQDRGFRPQQPFNRIEPGGEFGGFHGGENFAGGHGGSFSGGGRGGGRR